MHGKINFLEVTFLFLKQKNIKFNRHFYSDVEENLEFILTISFKVESEENGTWNGKIKPKLNHKD